MEQTEFRMDLMRNGNGKACKLQAKHCKLLSAESFSPLTHSLNRLERIELTACLVKQQQAKKTNIAMYDKNGKCGFPSDIFKLFHQVSWWKLILKV